MAAEVKEYNEGSSHFRQINKGVIVLNALKSFLQGFLYAFVSIATLPFLLIQSLIDL
jgi:hypothetical protein